MYLGKSGICFGSFCICHFVAQFKLGLGYCRIGDMVPLKLLLLLEFSEKPGKASFIRLIPIGQFKECRDIAIAPAHQMHHKLLQIGTVVT
ncbi:MAG: hypothetical protein AAGD09_20510 [Cyanobacteria bacterium P01_F01_bin.56]